MSKRLTTEKFIERAINVHGYKYGYSETIYINTKTKVKIKCNKHNISFIQTPRNHLSGSGCPQCGREHQITNASKTTTQFISNAINIHGNLYDYSEVNYINAHTKINIICNTHDSFWMKPDNHLSGSKCPRCKSSKGESKIIKILNELYIKYNTEYKFNDCILVKPLPFDFYIPNRNMCIEYDGEQHYKPIKHFGGIEKFKLTQKRDSIKNTIL